MTELEVKEQCKECFHFQVCANVLKQQLYIREKMLKERNPKCDNFVPAADVVEVVHGEWVDQIGLKKCSRCKTHQTEISNYCPNCGAKMDGKRRSE